MTIINKNIPPIPQDIQVDPQLRLYLERELNRHDPNLLEGTDPGHTHTFGLTETLHAPQHEVGGADLVDHNALTNYESDRHIAHSSVSITGGGLLSGGGAISASRVISLTNSAIDHDQTTNFVANEHIDWTNATQNLLTTGTITGADYSVVGGIQFGPTGLIYHPDGTIRFYTNNLTTSGDITAGGDITTTGDITATGDVTGANLNQYLLTTSIPTFAGLIVGQIGVTADTDLLDLEPNLLTVSGDINATQAITATSFTIGGDTLDTSEFGYLDGQNQYVFTTSAPTFSGLTIPTLTLNFSVQDYLVTNRSGNILVFQGQTSDTPAAMELFTKDGDNAASESVYFNFWSKGTPTVITNREILTIGTFSTQHRIYTQAAGTGTVRPIYIYTGANTTQCVFNTDNSISMSGSLGVTGNVTGANLNITNWDTAYTHSQDNTQAHSDYLINNGNDSTSGTITAPEFNIGDTVGTVPFVVTATISTGGTTNIYNANAPVAFRVIDVWCVNTAATAGNFTITDGTNNITSSIVTTANDKLRFPSASDLFLLEIDDAFHEIAVNGTLVVVNNTKVPASCIVYVLCMPI